MIKILKTALISFYEILYGFFLLRKHNIKHNIVLFGSARFPNTSEHYINANKISSKIAHLIQNKKHMAICSGGGGGIMEAANKGAFTQKVPSIALGIRLPHEQKINKYANKKLQYTFKYFFTRKYWLSNKTIIFIVFPGGYGTLDELFEILTLKQTGKVSPEVPIILYNSIFFKNLINHQILIDEGTINPNDINLFTYADNPDEVLKIVKTTLKRY